ncbi:Polyketide cyclase SnoaL-like domain [Macleaya cordata]|uniref:Polyketide cyclase SnoaL-like domain n=1 Tax=Macleaya cordata TaxID=56857 RepID=A0A200QHY4_MACCD|nr:Polyketide cyclase SnoaL-like domain [Macleaya cordata]
MATIRLPCASFSRCTRTSINENLVFKSSNLRHLHAHVERRGMYRGIRSKRKMVQDPVSTRQWAIMSSGKSTDIQPSPISPSDTIAHFYNCINSKNWKQLGDFISNDCCFEDYTFPKPFEGKEEVMQFFQQLTEGMGKNLKFVIHNMCRGDKSTVAIMWHLEWNDKQIPFTRGCSFYECIEQGDRFLIKHARVVIESLIKPGTLALTLLKLVTNLFDEFPTVTESTLTSSNFSKLGSSYTNEKLNHDETSMSRFHRVPTEALSYTTVSYKGLQHICGSAYTSTYGMLHQPLEIHRSTAQLRTKHPATYFKDLLQIGNSN